MSRCVSFIGIMNLSVVNFQVKDIAIVISSVLHAFVLVQAQNSRTCRVSGSPEVHLPKMQCESDSCRKC